MLKHLIIPLLFCFNSFAYTDNEIVAACLVLEAGGEKNDKAMLAVFEVIQNRARERHKTEKEICLQKWQFSCFNENIDKKLKIAANHPKYPLAVRIVQENRKTNFTNNANSYWSDSIIAPYWAGNKQITKIGRHNFVKL